MRTSISCIFLASSLAASAATLTVTTAADAGPGSLREALALAAPGDTITFGGATFTGPEAQVVIRLTSGELSVTKPLTIQGILNSAGNTKVVVTGDANASGTLTGVDSRAMSISTTTPGDVVVERLIFELCQTELLAAGGGAVTVPSTNQADVTFNRCRFLASQSSGNGGGGLYFSGTTTNLTVNNCRFEENQGKAGGGLYVHSANQVTIFSSEFVANKSILIPPAGGGIYIRNTVNLTVTNSLFQDNEAFQPGGGAFLSNSDSTFTGCLFIGNSATNGGGVAGTNVGAPTRGFEFTNCTFTGNESDFEGAAIRLSSSQDVLLAHNTVTGNSSNSNNSTGSGAIYLGPSLTVTLRGNIIAGNVDASTIIPAKHPDVFADPGAIVTSAGGNVVGVKTTAAPFFTSPGDKFGTLTTPQDAGLLPLADNGGPTLTHALHPVSPARDFATSSSTPNEDQRGEARPSGPARDSGAYEFAGVSFQTWAADRLSAYPVSERQALDDPDGDGLTNALEFLQGSAPAIRGERLDRMEMISGELFYSFALSNEADLSSLNLRLETSIDLTEWDAHGFDPSFVEETGAIWTSANASRTRYRFPLDLVAEPERFFRLRAGPLAP